MQNRIIDPKEIITDNFIIDKVRLVKKQIIYQKYGQIDPVLVSERNGTYYLLDGFYAVKWALYNDLEYVRCLVLNNLNEFQQIEITLYKNQKKDLNLFFINDKINDYLKHEGSLNTLINVLDMPKNEILNVIKLHEFEWNDTDFDNINNNSQLKLF